MQKIFFSSRDLPASLSEEARFRLWRDIWTAEFGAADVVRSEQPSFFAVSEVFAFGDVAMLRLEANIQSLKRNARHISSNPNDDFMLAVNRSQRTHCVQNDKWSVEMQPRSAMVHRLDEAVESLSRGTVSMIGVRVPRARLIDLAPDADSRTGVALAAENPALQHLLRYLDFLADAQEVSGSTFLSERTSAMIVDLVSLALGAGDERGKLASSRGLRAARLHDIAEIIRKRFTDPAFSSDAVAKQLGLSRRYVNELLNETGSSLTERVLELRLQKAKNVLADPRHDRKRVSDIAYACGFNEVSYFNRCFRRRFGCAPTDYRGVKD